jgi:hypothetical protein
MAPSATLPELGSQNVKTLNPKQAATSQSTTHVHSGVEKTPLQALSHGPLVLGGGTESFSLKSCLANLMTCSDAALVLTWIGIPTFSTYKEHREHILIHMAAMFRHWSRSGFTEGISGHISVRDPEFENYIWMNPLGLHFGLIKAGDMMCLDINTGAIVGGNRVLSLPLAEAHPYLELKSYAVR